VPGKTVVGEFAVHLALAQGRKCFYTTPIKALSNQKYNDLVDSARGRQGRPAHRRQRDQRRGAGGRDDRPRCCATCSTAARHAARPGYVVMDEVHYLADRFRGAVWEEVIIHLRRASRSVSLSATVSNAEEFADWLVTVRGETRSS
jgi:ATP-dependent RNA helicase HelY